MPILPVTKLVSFVAFFIFDEEVEQKFLYQDNLQQLRHVAHVRIQRGGSGSVPPSLKNHKNIGCLSNTGLDPLKITKLPSQHSMLGHHRHASETPFKWRSAGGPMMARWRFAGVPKWRSAGGPMMARWCFAGVPMMARL